MTHQQSRELRRQLAEASATAALEVAGVAWLRQDLATALRGATPDGDDSRDRALPSVRVRQLGDRGRWHAQIDLRIVLHRGHRAVNVSRAVGQAVREASETVLPAASRTDVTITITGIL